MSDSTDHPEYPPGEPLDSDEQYWHYKGWIPATKLPAWKRGQEGRA